MLALLGIVAATAALGNWQLRRADYKRDLQQQRDQAQTQAPVNLNRIDPGSGKLPASPASPVSQLDGKPVVVSGQWLTDKSIFIDNRTHQGVAGFHVISALQSGDSDNANIVLVLRGWIAADRLDRTRLPRIEHPPGVQTVRGYAEVKLAQAMQLGADVAPGPNDRLWQYFDLDKYNRWSGLSHHRFVVRQTSDTGDSLVRDWPIPGNDVDRHNGYAFQWFAMSLTALLFLLYLVWRWFQRRHAAPAAGD